jgi:hypothetical protein
MVLVMAWHLVMAALVVVVVLV